MSSIFCKHLKGWTVPASDSEWIGWCWTLLEERVEPYRKRGCHKQVGRDGDACGILGRHTRWLSSTLNGHRDGATLTDSGVRSGGSMQGIPSPRKMFTDWTKVKAEPPLSDTGTMEAMSLLAQASKFCFGSRDSVSGRRVLKVRRSGSETLVML